MESSESMGGEGSLFEGMILFSPSDPAPSSPPPPPSASDAPSSQSQPLDEDLFSDLTLQVPTPSLTLSPPQSPSKPLTPATSATPNPSPLRQVSRKKKRAVRIGYARDAVPIDDEAHVLPSSAASSPPGPLPPIFFREVTSTPPVRHEPAETSSTDSNHSRAIQLPDTSQSERETEQQEKPSATLNQDSSNEEEECMVESTSKSESDDNNGQVEKQQEGCDSIEQKLAVVRANITKKAKSARQRAESVMAKRKELAARRRKVGEELNKALDRHKELERELEAACEAEDFESAEKISNSLVSVEDDKNQLLLDLRSAELDYDSVESDMQDVLDFHIAAEEEAGILLQLFAKVM